MSAIVEDLSPDDLIISGGVAVEKQLPIDDDSKAKLLEIRTQIFFDESDALAEQLYNGDITLGAWEESMKKLIREIHSSAAAIGKGGWDNMEPEDWGRLGPEMKKQYRWLHNFAETIAEKRDVISLKALQARAKLYGKVGGHAAGMMQAGRIITEQLPWIPRDGSTECLNGCHCYWSLGVVSQLENGFNLVQARWNLGEAEHCPDCVARDGYIHEFAVHETVDVPTRIGGF